jgi:hypothetical protein
VFWDQSAGSYAFLEAGTGLAISGTTITAESPVKAWVSFNGLDASGTYSRTGTLVTVTLTGHGMATGQSANLDFTSGTATDGTYTVTVVDANTFTVNDSVSGATSGNVTRRFFIRASLNVGSITRNSTGNFTITFSAPFADANYAVSLAYSDEVNVQHTVGFVQTVDAASVRVKFHNAGNAVDTSGKSYIALSVCR